MNKKQKIIIAGIFAAILIIAAGAALLLNNRETQAGTKNFKIEVISEEDQFTQVIDASSDLIYLGEYLRTLPDCQWTERSYGSYITGWYDIVADESSEEYWWISVNDEDAAYGVDQIPLQGGDKYTFTLMKGYE